ncbi:hypothetical protein, partial [Klebsiella pneumoniae]|uniref:hypothetical protein n=1 Tax=Klebsiella pneumoniae TaxID=573 RepID=UPI0013D75F13
YLLAAHVASHWLAGPGRKARFRASLAPLAAGAVAGLALIAVPVVLTALWGEQSNRVAIDLEGAGRGSLHPGALLTLAIGNLYG